MFYGCTVNNESMCFSQKETELVTSPTAALNNELRNAEYGRIKPGEFQSLCKLETLKLWNPPPSKKKKEKKMCHVL